MILNTVLGLKLQDLGAIAKIATGVVGVVVALITLYIRYLGYVIKEKTANNSGALRSPNIALDLLNTGDNANFYIAVPFGGKHIVRIPLHIHLTNLGDKEVKNARLVMDVHSQLYLGDINTTGMDDPLKLMRNYGIQKKNKNFITFKCDFDTIYAGEGTQTLVWPIQIMAGSFEFTVSAKTKDGFDVSLKCGISYPINISIFYENGQTIKGTWTFSFFNSSKDEIAKRFQDQNERFRKHIPIHKKGWRKLKAICKMAKFQNAEVKKFALILCDEPSEAINEELGIYAVPSKSLIWCQGYEFNLGHWFGRGYVIPALGVYLSDSTIFPKFLARLLWKFFVKIVSRS